MGSALAVIIVSHNSQAHLPTCLQFLAEQQEQPAEIIVVDSGSEDSGYLHTLQESHSFQLICRQNIGFARANNAGVRAIRKKVDHILFLNPDLYLPPGCIETALAISRKRSEAGILSGKLLSYKNEEQEETTRIDSTGITRQIYGRWVDRGQGEVDHGQYDTEEEMQALCGAMLLCKVEALKDLGGTVFDPDFFLYKEDIELCLRMQKQGWKTLYHPAIIAYHCRGWQGERAKMSLFLRKTAAVSEVMLYRKHPSPYMVWALFKYLLVTVFRL